ncbi:hypothetical protein M23134_02720 [Microscilla marina ATCC 23134]|uniref:Uncharacterized protein n=1 Tax=Microscilla marina ATCC 23134 TaxID=313606 RepID=A1ZZ32_MICM2|nr:hypothetical protein M23134_02720 [Microscilla marina ATCC 23134]
MVSWGKIQSYRKKWVIESNGLKEGRKVCGKKQGTKYNRV